jgi:hypothetical protein
MPDMDWMDSTYLFSPYLGISRWIFKEPKSEFCGSAKKAKPNRFASRRKNGQESKMTLAEQIQKQLFQLPPDKQSEVLDFITFLQERVYSTQTVSGEAERKERLKKAFATLANLGTFADITDPVEWQRQIRKDRPLPGRES